MHINVLALDGVFDLGLSAVLDVLQTANELIEMSGFSVARFEPRIVGVRRSVKTAHGLTVPVRPIGSRTPDCVVVPAIGFKMPAPLEAALTRPDVQDATVALQRWARRGSMMTAACVGTFVMAESGLLDEHHATTTWWLAPLFRKRYPRVLLDESNMIVKSGRFVTAGAALSHMDLALWLVRSVSPQLATLTAKYLIVDTRPSQSAYALTDHLQHDDPVVQRFEGWARSRLTRGFSLDEAAKAVGASKRTLARHMEDVLGKTPLSYFQNLRVERAVHLLKTGTASVDEIAARVGYADGATLRALLRRQLNLGSRRSGRLRDSSVLADGGGRTHNHGPTSSKGMPADERTPNRPNGEFNPPVQHAPLPGSDADYRVLANALPHILWTRDAQGRLEWVNDRWYELTGLSEEETLRGTGPTAAIHPEDHEHVKRAWRDAIATSTTCEINYRIRNRAGEYRWHLARVVPIRDGNGTVTRWVSAIIDMHEHWTAEQALLEWERRFEAVFSVIPHATAIVRVADATHLQINDAFTRLTGYTPDDIIGQSVMTLGMWRAEERAAYVQPLATPPGGSTVVPFRTKDGRWLRLSLSGRHLDFGGEPCMVTVGIDVTEQETNEAALRLSEAQASARADELAALMEAVPAAVWISRDPECLDIRGNRASYEMLRVDSSENMYGPAVNRRFVIAINGAEVPVDMLPLERATRGEEVRNHEEEVRFGDGEVRHLFGSAVPLRDAAGTPRGAIGAYVDVTRLKQVEAALREADRRKDEFLALLSHELRNPLAPILTAAQILKLRADAEAHIDLDVIIRQAKHLVRLVDDLLDVSRVTRGRVALTKRHIELSTIVARAVEATGHLFESRQHHLELSVPSEGLAVDADEVRLTQVLNNLLSNAAHFTPPGGTVTVIGAREGDDVVLRVRDTGLGIDPALIPNLFEMFMQGERGRARTEGGLGLGLSLVRALTEQHGGTATAYSEGLGRGSEFSIRLPALQASGRHVAPASTRPTWQIDRRGRGTRVLVVDDNRDVLDTVARLLSIAGYETQTASDAVAALTLASQFRPRIAILDIGLPVMDGYQLARELRAHWGEDPPTLIALTGYNQADDRERSREAGFACHLAKPIDADELLRVLDAASALPA